MRSFTLAVLALCSFSIAFSQDKIPVTFRKVTPEDFILPRSSLIDSNTSAVVLADVGSTRFFSDGKSSFILRAFTVNCRIRILEKKAFELATIRIRLSGGGRSQDKLDSLEATTYNLENGKVVETKLDPKEVFRENRSRGNVLAKFTFPALKEGSIIEYSYKVISSHFWILPSWLFQYDQCPCLYSRYEVGTPNMFGYLSIKHGDDPFTINKTEKVKEKYVTAGLDIRSEVTNRTWVIENMPPFKTEEFLDHPYDHKDRIEFHMVQMYNGSDVIGNIDWNSATRDLLEERHFGAAITEEGASNLHNTVEALTAQDHSYRLAAKHLYSYIRDNFACTPDDEIYLGDDPYDINKKKSGAPEDLNLLLVAMLRQKKINASPVILSTTEYGTNPASYPIMEKMNYVVCMIKMGFDTIFLDASRPLLGFGKLPLNCYNGHARIISDHDTGSIYFDRDAIKEQRSTAVFIMNDEKAKDQIGGTVEITPGYFESYDIRNRIKKEGKTDFFKNIKQSAVLESTITNLGIDSLKNLEEPVKIHYEFNTKIEDGQDLIYFSPVVNSNFLETPFKFDVRKYPIEMPYPVDDRYVLFMEIPEGFEVEELPKSTKFAYNINQGVFEYLIQKNEGNIQLQCRIKLNKASFAAEDYNSLREFFSFVVKKLNEQIVFKKKK